ncbi:fimbria/pilus periplasmic chaperone [Providencia hangzhouensis]|uniref:fimbria/pilus periplasmic chaperone n=1 Tax=Providencia hangzhouensis TaxID=3031799 RepID=UPI0034DD790A
MTPPVHRIEANSKSQIKIQSLPAISQLPKDRESIYYLNVREIPPRSEKANVLQIALQTKIKIFIDR